MLSPSMGFEQQRIFLQEGVDLSRVIIGHPGDTTDLNYLERLIDNGSYIGMDRFGLDVRLPFDARVATVAALCERGHADLMVLSHDFASYHDGMTEGKRERLSRAAAVIPISSMTSYPPLHERGVTDDQLNQMLISNPREIFDSQNSY